MQLKEAKEGLSAASRLNEQLDRKSQTIAELKQKGKKSKKCLYHNKLNRLLELGSLHQTVFCGCHL